MNLHDRFDGSASPFEGDRTISWRSLPADALVTRATVTLEPPQTPVAETISFASSGDAHGATTTSVSGTPTNADVDFHARRTLASVSGSSINTATLSVDLGAGAFVGVKSDGTIPLGSGAPQFTISGDTNAALPPLTVSRFRLSLPGASTSTAISSVDVASVATNVTIRLDAQPQFYAKVGELVSLATADFTNALAAYLPKAPSASGYFDIPIVIHSDSLCRLTISIDVEYSRSSPLIKDNLPEATLAYAYATVPKNGADTLSASLPANASVVPRLTTTRVRGGFDATRIGYGPTGQFTSATGASAACSPDRAQAQAFTLPDSLAVVGIDVFCAPDPPAARLRLDLREDFSGKPGERSVLTKSAETDLTSLPDRSPSWSSVALAAECRLTKGTVYWLVVQCIDGSATLPLAVPADASAPLLQSSDGGFSWRPTTAPQAVSPVNAAGPFQIGFRLRTQPAPFTIPISLQVGTAPTRVTFEKFAPLGRIEFDLDATAVASAVNDVVKAADGTVRDDGELLQDPAFAQWSSTGDQLAVDSTWSIQAPSSPGLAVTMRPAIAARTAAVAAGTTVLLAATFFGNELTSALIPRSVAQLLASPDGVTIYAFTGAELHALDSTTLNPTGPPIAFTARTIAIAPDGATMYGAGSSGILSLDLAGGASRILSTVNASRLAVSGDGATLFTVTSTTTNQELQALDIASGQTQPLLQADLFAAIDALGSSSVVAGYKTGTTRAVSAVASTGGRALWTQTTDDVVAVAGASDGTHAYALTIDAADVYHVLRFPPGTAASDVTPTPASGGSFSYLATTPHDERVFAGQSALVVVAPGDRLATLSSDVAAVNVGTFGLAKWWLTSGTVRPQQVDGYRVEALLGTPPASGTLAASAVVVPTVESAVSQVVAIYPSATYAFAVDALRAGDRVDARAEVFLLDDTGTQVHSDSLDLGATGGTAMSLQIAAPSNASQAEVRFRVIDGSLTLRRASLRAITGLLASGSRAAGSWSISGQGRIVLSGSGALLHNSGTDTATFTQGIPVDAGASYQVSVDGARSVAANDAPQLEIHFLDASGTDLGNHVTIGFPSLTFPHAAAAFDPPKAAANMQISFVLPRGSTLRYSALSFNKVPKVNVPLTFIAQSPGSLRISNARLAYDLGKAPPPKAPSGGVAPPTPPGRTPGEVCNECYCAKCMAQRFVRGGRIAASPRGAMTVGTCATCGSPVSGPTRGVPIPSAPPVRIVPVPPAILTPATPVTIQPAAPPRPSIAPAQPSPAELTVVPGIGDRRAAMLRAAGITNARELANADPADVARIIGGVGMTPARATRLVEGARALNPTPPP